MILPLQPRTLIQTFRAYQIQNEADPKIGKVYEFDSFPQLFFDTSFNFEGKFPKNFPCEKLELDNSDLLVFLHKQVENLESAMFPVLYKLPA